MILLFLFGTFALFGRVWNISTVNLVLNIISMRLCVSLIFYWKFGSILALIWVLVYLGGMMVCFVYILFITYSDSHISKKLIKSNELYSLPTVTLFTMILLKSILIICWGIYKPQLVNWTSSAITFRETYTQISSQSPFFFFRSAIVLLYGLMQILFILNMKNKTRSYPLL